MVRVNLINPGNLADQHLIAEYSEILMLVAYAKKYPSTGNIPKNYSLGKGHIKFFKNKLAYLKDRHELLKKEMAKRGFKPKRTVSLKGFNRKLINSWKPDYKDKKIIKKRLMQKIGLKPKFYRYCGKKMPKNFFIGLIKKA